MVKASNIEERYDLLIKVPPPGLLEPLRNSESFTLESDPRWAPLRGAELGIRSMIMCSWSASTACHLQGSV